MPQDLQQDARSLKSKFAAMSDQDLKAEADRLYRLSERESLGSFFRNEKSRVTYDKYLVAWRDLHRRKTLATLEAAEKRRVKEAQEHLAEVLKRRPANPTGDGDILYPPCQE